MRLGTTWTTAFAIAFGIVVSSSSGWGAEISTVQVDGGSNITVLGGSIEINSNSSLRRTFYVINDPSSPVVLVDTGIVTRYDERLKFYPKGHVEASQDIAAFEMVFVIFDVFGDQMYTLKYISLEDFSSGDRHEFPQWNAWAADRNDVEEYLTSVSYVSKARTVDGKIWKADFRQIEAEIRQIGIVATAAEIVPPYDEGQGQEDNQ
jgi:hypothetical protein